MGVPLKRLFLALALLFVTAWTITVFEPQDTPHAFAGLDFCGQTQNGISALRWQTFALRTINCVQLNPQWSALDTGTTFALFNYTAWDLANLAPYTGRAMSTCTNNGVTTTCTIASGTWAFFTGQDIYIRGGSGSCAGSHSVGTNSSTVVNFASPSCTYTGGVMLNACGGLLPQGAQPCGIIIMSAMTDAAGIQNNAAWPFSQPAANTICGATPWVASSQFGLNGCIKVAGTYYHNTGMGTNGYCVTGLAFAVGADGTCNWVSDGATNAFVQEASVTAGFNGNANAPTAYTNGGATFSSVTSNCVTTNPCPPADVATGFPYYWETPIIAALKQWCAGTDGNGTPGFLQHYASVIPASQYIAAECGAPQGVEWFLANATYIQANYSMNLAQLEGLFINFAANSIWAAIHTLYVSLGASTWGMLVPDGIYSGCPSDPACSLYSDLIATVSLVYSENSPGNYGLRNANLTTYASTGVVRGDWIGIFAKYPNTKYHIVEPFSVSCPIWAGSGGCNAPTQQVTGAFAVLLPFATQHVVTGSAVPIFIVFGDDLVWPYDGTFTPSAPAVLPTGPSVPDQQILVNAAAGVPNSTSSIQGTAKISGNAVIK